MDQYETKATNLLKRVLKVKTKDIDSFRHQSNGYTNHSYVFRLKNKQRYVVRIGLVDKWLKRDNEINVLRIIKNHKSLFNVLYFNPSNGDMVRPYIVGITPGKQTVYNKKFLKTFALTLKQLHSIKVPKNTRILVNDFRVYSEFDHYLQPIYTQAFYQLLNKFEKSIKLVFSHNDLSPWNMIYQAKTNQLTFIDFEWSRLNFPYVDLANFIKESDLYNTPYEKYVLKCYDPKLKLKTLHQFLYIAAYFSYVWTYSMFPYKHIVKYRNKMLKMLKSLYSETQK